MLWQVLKSSFSKRKASVPFSSAKRDDPDRPGGVVFLANVDKARELDPADRLESDQASLRLRVWIPALHLLQRVPVHLVPLDYMQSDPQLASLGDVRVIVIGKFSVATILKQQDRFDALADWAASIGEHCRVVADLCDDLAAAGQIFNEPYLERFQRRLSNACVLTVSTNSLAERLRPIAKHGVHVVEDPYESSVAGTPHFEVGPTLRLLWFGVFGPSFRPFVESQLIAIARGVRGRPVEMVFLTNASHAALVSEMAQVIAAVNPAFSLRFEPWSLAAAAQAREDCDIVTLPQETGSPWGNVKSHNRLVETIRAGRFAVASSIPAYLELRDYAWIDNNLSAGIAWALDHPAEVVNRIAAGQEYVAQRFSPHRIGRRWEEVLGLHADSDAKSVGADVVRLNLGCGDKILPGYINVDVAPTRAGRQPDVISDLHNLEAFEDETADEIMAIHVIEHFWRWEVLDGLREWVRVLKPGGHMILECPNLVSACEEFLEDPDARSGPGLEGQRTMWVFYGDPAWRDPLMTHRWAYTPKSLKALMEEAGLVNIRQEAAQFKLREPRDMRLVGEKAATGG